MQVATLVLSIISLFLSLGQICYHLYKSRMNVTIGIKNIEIGYHSGYNRYFLAMIIQNVSSAPISITGMQINGISNLLQHQYVGERYFPKFEETDTPCSERILSADFPIDLAPNTSTLAYVAFDFYDGIEFPNHMMTLYLNTDKRAKTYTLTIPDPQPNAYALR